MKPARRIDPADADVGRRVRLRRMQLGISQSKLGDELGVTFQQVQKYEQGTNRIAAGRLKTLAAVLDVPVTFFFDKLPGGKASEPVLDFIDNALSLRLMQAFSKIEDRKLQYAVVELIEQAVSQSKSR